MRSVRLIVAIVLGLVGLLWIGQGIGAIGGSVMSGQSIWAVIGAILIVVALWLGWSGFRASARPGSGSARGGGSGEETAG